MSATASAGWPLPALLTSLSRAGWGEQLDGAPNAGLRTVLRGLEALLPRRSAAGHVTEAQVADVTGLSVRWVRRCMRELEALGLLEWHRGGIRRGRPRPSFVTVVKRRLVELLAAARERLTRRRGERAETTRERLASLPPNVPGRARSRTSRHAELSSTLPPQGEVTAPAYRRRPAPAAPGRPVSRETPTEDAPEVPMPAGFRDLVASLMRRP